jgi:hypothetical protein
MHARRELVRSESGTPLKGTKFSGALLRDRETQDGILAVAHWSWYMQVSMRTSVSDHASTCITKVVNICITFTQKLENWRWTENREKFEVSVQLSLYNFRYISLIKRNHIRYHKVKPGHEQENYNKCSLANIDHELVSFGAASGPLLLHLCYFPLRFSLPSIDTNLCYLTRISRNNYFYYRNIRMGMISNKTLTNYMPPW